MASYYTKHLIEAEREKRTEFSTCNMIGGSSKVRQPFCRAWVPKMDLCHVWVENEDDRVFFGCTRVK